MQYSYILFSIIVVVDRMSLCIGALVALGSTDQGAPDLSTFMKAISKSHCVGSVSSKKICSHKSMLIITNVNVPLPACLLPLHRKSSTKSQSGAEVSLRLLLTNKIPALFLQLPLDPK